MSKYKIVVYAISKNEEKFVNRWVDSMKEADDIYVLDTGSTDNTVESLKKLGVHVTQEIISPWRFDVARNKSLDLVPSDVDICVCTDLDEVFLPGWRKKLEEIWKDNTTRLRYNYNWKLSKDNIPEVNFYIEKIHTRQNYYWVHPVHEVLYYKKDNEIFITTDDITLNHYPDNNKSRSSYLPLLELSVKEQPENDRNMHYLGREYMYYGKYEDAIKTLKRHLELKSATWKDERCASMRFISRCYKNLNNYSEAKHWADLAMKEAPHLRDPFVERALIDYDLKDWNQVINHCFKALDIKHNPKTYINEPFCYDHTIYDLLSIAFFQKELYKFSLVAINEALTITPNEQRLINNKAIIEEKVKTESSN